LQTAKSNLDLVTYLLTYLLTAKLLAGENALKPLQPTERIGQICCLQPAQDIDDGHDDVIVTKCRDMPGILNIVVEYFSILHITRTIRKRNGRD